MRRRGSGGLATAPPDPALDRGPSGLRVTIGGMPILSRDDRVMLCPGAVHFDRQAMT